MAIADRYGFPYALHVDSATPHEVTLVNRTIEGRFMIQLPERIIGDKAYDSDPLDAEMATIGVQVIAPHKANRKRTQTQDGRSLRRYRRRWKVERWLQNFRRMAQLGSILILHRLF